MFQVDRINFWHMTCSDGENTDCQWCFDTKSWKFQRVTVNNSTAIHGASTKTTSKNSFRSRAICRELFASEWIDILDLLEPYFGFVLIEILKTEKTQAESTAESWLVAPKWSFPTFCLGSTERWNVDGLPTCRQAGCQIGEALWPSLFQERPGGLVVFTRNSQQNWDQSLNKFDWNGWNCLLYMLNPIKTFLVVFFPNFYSPQKKASFIRPSPQNPDFGMSVCSRWTPF